MIESLTQEQQDKLVVYRDRWIGIGLCTDPIDKDACKHWIAEAYKAAGLKPPNEYIFTSSPNECNNLLINEYGIKKEDINNTTLYGFQDAPWLSFYNYFLEVCELDVCKKLHPLMELSKVCGWWVAYDTHAFIQDRPCEIHLNDAKQLHCEDGAAVLYRDGWGIYSLNGVRVDKEIILTPSDELDCNLIVTTKNAEIRRELVRKIGVERIYDQLGGKVIDSQGDYELVTLNLGDNNPRPYLKMVNPSIDTIHIEGVPPGTQTVVDALAWRNGLDQWIEPQLLT